jgi:hypothetical protein
MTEVESGAPLLTRLGEVRASRPYFLNQTGVLCMPVIRSELFRGLASILAQGPSF